MSILDVRVFANPVTYKILVLNTFNYVHTLQVKNIEHLDAGVKAMVMAQLTNV